MSRVRNRCVRDKQNGAYVAGEAGRVPEAELAAGTVTGSDHVLLADDGDGLVSVDKRGCHRHPKRCQQAHKG